MKFRTIASALALLAVAVAKPAGAQEISGKYAIFLQTTCQTIMSGTAILSAGGVSSSIGIADFTPNPKHLDTGIVDIAETVIGGSPAASKTGSLRADPRHSTVPYSTTETTLTINGIRYNAIYPRSQAGIAGQVFFNGIAAAGKLPNACAVSGLLRAVAG